MSGLGGLNKTPDGVVIGLVQLQLPTIADKGDLAAQTKKICAMVRKARKAMVISAAVIFPMTNSDPVSGGSTDLRFSDQPWFKGSRLFSTVVTLSLWLIRGRQSGHTQTTATSITSTVSIFSLTWLTPVFVWRSL